MLHKLLCGLAPRRTGSSRWHCNLPLSAERCGPSRNRKCKSVSKQAFSHGQSTTGSETPVVRLKIESRVPRVHGGVRITDIRRICTDQPLCATSLGCQPRVSQRWYDPVLQLEAAKGNSQVLEVLYAPPLTHLVTSNDPPTLAHTGTVTGRYYCTQ